MEVDGGALDTPYLSENPDDSDAMAVMDNTGYSMVVSQFQVRYAVLDCGFGMGLLVDCYDENNEARIQVEQVSQRPHPLHLFIINLS